MRLEGKLVELCKEALKYTIIDPNTKITAVECRSFRSTRFDSADEKTVYLITITTNDPVTVRGAVGYKGSYTERLEGLLDFVAKQEWSLTEVHINVEGPEGGSAQKLVAVDAMVTAGQVDSESPVVKTARNFDIPHILIRGRHVIAPSPAIAQYLSDLLQKEEPQVRRVLDLFGGTGLTAKVVCKLSDPSRVVVLEKDPRNFQFMCEHIHDRRVHFVNGDAFTYEIAEQFDLAVADPYYEDVADFLRLRLDPILRHARIVLLVPGNLEDVTWNTDIENTLIDKGLTIKRCEAFGQVMLEVRKPS